MNEQELAPKTVESEMSPEQILALSKKVTILMTKPENQDMEMLILTLLKHKGLKGVCHRFVLDENRLNNLYPDMKNWIEAVQIMTKEHLLDKEVEVFLVTADNENTDINVIDVREEVLKLRGLKRLADENPEGTLRREFHGNTIHFFGKAAEKAEKSGYVEYSKNGFHCSTTPEEVLSNLKTFGLLEEAKKLVGME